jgi:hypothetical protein
MARSFAKHTPALRVEQRNFVGYCEGGWVAGGCIESGHRCIETGRVAGRKAPDVADNELIGEMELFLAHVDKALSMIRNYFRIAWRSLAKNRVYSFINIHRAGDGHGGGHADRAVDPGRAQLQ